MKVNTTIFPCLKGSTQILSTPHEAMPFDWCHFKNTDLFLSIIIMTCKEFHNVVEFCYL